MDTIGLALALQLPAGVTDPAVPFAVTANMPYERWSMPASTLDDGNPLITGGRYYNSASNSTSEDNRVYRYNVDANTWTALAAIPGTAQWDHGQSTLHDGTVLTTGSRTGGTQCNLYDPVANTWTTRAPLPFTRYDHAQVTLDDGRVMLMAGWANGSTGTKSWFYDPAANTWDTTTGASLPADFPTGGRAALLTDGTVLYGGGGGSTTYNAYLYDPVANTWTRIADFVGAKGGGARPAAITGNVDGVKALMLGGATHNGIGVYDKATNTWAVSSQVLANNRPASAVTVIPDGRVFVAGSNNSSDNIARKNAELGRVAREIMEPIRAALVGHLASK